MAQVQASVLSGDAQAQALYAQVTAELQQLNTSLQLEDLSRQVDQVLRSCVESIYTVSTHHRAQRMEEFRCSLNSWERQDQCGPRTEPTKPCKDRE